MPAIPNPTEEVGALVLTLAAGGVQVKRGAGAPAAGAAQSVLYWDDPSGDVYMASGSGPGLLGHDGAIDLRGRGGVRAAGVKADGVFSNALSFYLHDDPRYMHQILGTISGSSSNTANALRFNLNAGAYGTYATVLELRGGNSPLVYVPCGEIIVSNNAYAIVELDSVAYAMLTLNGGAGTFAGVQFMNASVQRWGYGRGWASATDDLEWYAYNGLGLVGAIKYATGVLSWAYSVVVGATDPGGSALIRTAGNMQCAALIVGVSGGVYTAGVRMVYMSALTGTAYTIINAPDGSNGILLGMGDPANYYNNSVHYFRNRATDVTYGYWNATALQLNTQLFPRGLNANAVISMNTAWEYLEVAVGATVNVCAFAYGMVEISEWQSYGDCALLFLHNGGIEIVFQNATNRFGTSAAFYYQLAMVGGYLTLKNNSPNLMRFGGFTRAHK